MDGGVDTVCTVTVGQISFQQSRCFLCSISSGLFTDCTYVNGLISLKRRQWWSVNVLKVFFGSPLYYVRPPSGKKQVLVSPEGKPISHAFTFWSTTVNDRVEILAEGFPRVVIGELRGHRGGSILAHGCMHVNICVQNKFYC